MKVKAGWTEAVSRYGAKCELCGEKIPAFQPGTHRRRTTGRRGKTKFVYAHDTCVPRAVTHYRMVPIPQAEAESSTDREG